MAIGSARTHRASDRGVTLTFRVSDEEREEIKRRAYEQGMSVQAYAAFKLLDVVTEPRKSGPPRAKQRDEELPIAI